MKKFARWVLVRLGDSIFNRASYWYLHRKYGIRPSKLNLRKPVKFNEKLIWLKINFRHPNATTIADKISAKVYVSDLIGAKYIIPTIAIYSSADEILLNKLPKSFVLKANHGSNWGIVVNDRDSLNIDEVRKDASRWLSMNYYDIGREHQYRDIIPRLIIEKMLLPSIGQLLDYKFHCFNGVAKFVQVDVDRFISHKRNFYDLEWNLLPFTILYPAFDGEISAPSKLEEMIYVVECLSSGFPFIRVDLYECDGDVYFGEMTLHPGGGFELIQPEIWDRKIGDMLLLSRF